MRIGACDRGDCFICTWNWHWPELRLRRSEIHVVGHADCGRETGAARYVDPAGEEVPGIHNGRTPGNIRQATLCLKRVSEAGEHVTYRTSDCVVVRWGSSTVRVYCQVKTAFE